MLRPVNWTWLIVVAGWSIVVLAISQGRAAHVHMRPNLLSKKEADAVGFNDVLENLNALNEQLNEEDFKSHVPATHHVTSEENNNVEEEVVWPEVPCSADFGSFECNSGQCILLAFRCDQDKDCDDGSDETGCPDTLPNFIVPGNDGHDTPPADVVPIQSNAQAEDQLEQLPPWNEEQLPPSWNEVQCGSELFFACASGRCILDQFRCDGDKDCEEGEDEAGCPLAETLPPPPPPSPAAAADAQPGSSEATQFRLNDGKKVAVGRLEVYHNGQWGTVCDDGFGEKEATVACVGLGYRRGVRSPASASLQLEAINRETPIWLDDVQCRGTELSLGECSHNNWGQHNCRHQEDVYIRCSGVIDDDTETDAGDDVSGSGSGDDVLYF